MEQEPRRRRGRKPRNQQQVAPEVTKESTGDSNSEPQVQPEVQKPTNLLRGAEINFRKVLYGTRGSDEELREAFSAIRDIGFTAEGLRGHDVFSKLVEIAEEAAQVLIEASEGELTRDFFEKEATSYSSALRNFFPAGSQSNPELATSRALPPMTSAKGIPLS